MSRIFLVAIILITTASLAHAQGKKYALVVGVEKYDPAQLSPLDYAEDDAIEIGKALEAIGFDVVVMTSQSNIPDRQPVLANDILNQLDRRLRNRDAADTIIVSLSGHGVQLKSDTRDGDGAKETYFCPQRATLSDKSSLLPMSAVLERLSKSSATRKVLLVDACRNEVEPRDVRNKSAEIELDPAGVMRRTIPRGMIALFSCSSSERSYELKSLGHSVFSYHVIQYLSGKADPVRYPKQELSISELTTYVSRETHDLIDSELNKDQTPELVLLDRSKLTDWSLGRLGGSRVPSVPSNNMPSNGSPKPTNSGSQMLSEGTSAREVRDDNALGIKLVWIPGGSFTMGSLESEVDRYDNEAQVSVTLSRGFWLGQTEITQGQWKRLMGTEPWKGKEFVKEGDNFPASYISWNDATEYFRKLTEQEGKLGHLPSGWRYRLPTEAQWEYACRAGTSTRFSFGDSDGDLSHFSWWGGLFGNGNTKSERYAHEVGLKQANKAGLYDMHGNVCEWCDDILVSSLPGGRDPLVSSGGFDRVARGGGWFNDARRCRSAYRNGYGREFRYYDLGFRVAVGP